VCVNQPHLTELSELAGISFRAQKGAIRGASANDNNTVGNGSLALTQKFRSKPDYLGVHCGAGFFPYS